MTRAKSQNAPNAAVHGSSVVVLSSFFVFVFVFVFVFRPLFSMGRPILLAIRRIRLSVLVSSPFWPGRSPAASAPSKHFKQTLLDCSKVFFMSLVLRKKEKE